MQDNLIKQDDGFLDFAIPMTKELSRMASKAGHPMAAYLYEMALMELNDFRKTIKQERCVSERARERMVEHSSGDLFVA